MVKCGNCGAEISEDETIPVLAFHASGQCWLEREFDKLKEVSE